MEKRLCCIGEVDVEIEVDVDVYSENSKIQTVRYCSRVHA